LITSVFFFNFDWWWWWGCSPAAPFPWVHPWRQRHFITTI